VTTATQTREPRTTHRLDAMLASINDLPTIPETLIHILNVIDDPDSGPSDLAEAVRRDAPLMTKILKLANSPYYSPRGGIADINRCVAVLGYRTVRQVAICVSVATVVVKAVEESGGELDYRELWRHSVVTGAIAKHLAQMNSHPDPEAVFTAGLLHDVGKFILELHAPETYARVVQERNGRELVMSELETFGFDHAELGAAFARAWRFPSLLSSTFGGHHLSPDQLDPEDPHWHETALVSLADYLANTIEPPRSDLGSDPTKVKVEALYLATDLTLEDLELNLAAMRESIDRAATYLNMG